jgi:predicted DNA-binding transcriptional regulator AlpA
MSGRRGLKIGQRESRPSPCGLNDQQPIIQALHTLIHYRECVDLFAGSVHHVNSLCGGLDVPISAAFRGTTVDSESIVQPLLRDHQVAAICSVSVASVRRWRLQKSGPRYVKLNGAVRYQMRDIVKWLNSRPDGGVICSGASCRRRGRSTA